MIKNKIEKNRPWSDYPIGTKVFSINGGYWIRNENGWKWFIGDTFNSPGADAIGKCILLPVQNL